MGGGSPSSGILPKVIFSVFRSSVLTVLMLRNMSVGGKTTTLVYVVCYQAVILAPVCDQAVKLFPVC